MKHKTVAASQMRVALTMVGALCCAPVLASSIPLIIDDVIVTIPCADVYGNTGTGGAMVVVAEKYAISNAAGDYTIRCLLPGTYTVTATKLGITFVTPEQTITVAPGSSATIAVHYTPNSKKYGGPVAWRLATGLGAPPPQVPPNFTPARYWNELP